ncbi:5061_t:CDS:2 [Funneliformis mosseae]|uniref:5061_t:CDS:1 n=1 Tax=Funneliformis mosseae TaxID=27381 RepID=A0A9N8WHA4_FUNMO|nr:5061_t:CDS:2 [Funneliformis mosseae]
MTADDPCMAASIVLSRSKNIPNVPKDTLRNYAEYRDNQQIKQIAKIYLIILFVVTNSYNSNCRH